MSIDWTKEFSDRFKSSSIYIKENKFIPSMHPDHFILHNSLKEDVFEGTIKEVYCHAYILDSLNLELDAKI